MKKVISLDLSISSTGFAIFDESGKLEEYGIINPEKYSGYSKDRYPIKTVKFMRTVVDQVVGLIADIHQSYGIKAIIIEEVNLAGISSMIGNKGLCGLHFAIMICLEDLKLLDLVQFYPTSLWRKAISLRLSEADKLNNRVNPKNKVSYKDLSIQYVNKNYNLQVSDDEADAIAIGESFFKLNS